MKAPTQTQLSPTEIAHRDLRNLILNGRTLINGQPLTANEQGIIIQGEQMLFSKAMQFDRAQALAAQAKEPKLPEVPAKPDAKIIPIKEPTKKE